MCIQRIFFTETLNLKTLCLMRKVLLSFIKGYLKITDFGISRIWSPKNDQDTSGTPGYMAPEVMLKSGHGIACDLFAAGVIGYECILGKVIKNLLRGLTLELIGKKSER